MSAEPFPIRITALRARDFRGLLGEFELSIERGLTLIVGENGAGKSSILNAIEWCLFGGESTKKSSGIDERADFEVRHRSAEGDVSVTLVLAVDGGEAELNRSRDADAKKSAPDELRLSLPDGSVLTAGEVTDWLAWNHLPDWSVWKHAFCQHQELLRARVTNSAERSTQLARLLGLDEYQEYTACLRSLKPQRLKKVAAEELERVEEQLQHSLDRPGREQREVEGQLESRGVGRTELNEAWLLARLAQQLEAARGVTARLELATEVPDAAGLGLEDWGRWSREWERSVNAACSTAARELGSLRSDIGELESTLAGVEPARRALEDAQRALDKETREHGGEDQLSSQLAELEAERAAMLEREKGRNATVALLRQAALELERRASTGECPVCEAPQPDLKASLVARVEREGGDQERAAREALNARQASLNEQRTRLNQRRSALEQARTSFEGSSTRLERFVGATSDPAKAAEAKRREWMKRIETLESVLDESRGRLEELRCERELFELFGKWQAASNQAEAAAGDLGRIRAWVELQNTIDEAASLMVDLDALATLARSAQESRSREQVEAVNATLGRHSDTIFAGSGLRVTVKSTATQLKYQLVNEAGQEVLPILNQAALNALSFAILFAQAEARAAASLPAWVALDDPGQSLDEERLDGLARSIEAVAEKLPVIVATYPSALEARLRRSPGCQVVELAAPRVQSGVVVRSVSGGATS